MPLFSLIPAGRTRRLFPLLALLAAAVAARPAAAQPNLNVEMGELAKEVKKALDDRNETAIAVGQFVPLPGTVASAGPAIAKELADELTKLGVDVRLRAGLTIEGRYGLNEDAASGRLAVSLNVKIVDKTGEEIAGIHIKPRGIFGDSTIAALLGESVDLPPDAPPKDRDAKLQNSLEKPQAYLDPTHNRVKASEGSPYAVEILLKGKDGSYSPCPVEEKEGLSFVNLQKDDVYRVRVYNDADYEIAAQLTIDGLNMFTFSEIKDPKTGKPMYDRLLVKPHSYYDIPGWHRNNDKNGSDEFQITKYADSEAAKMYPNSANVGTITVAVAACWPKDGAPPADEPKSPDANARSADLGTKRGAQTGTGYTEVEREFGVTRAAISVRYSK